MTNDNTPHPAIAMVPYKLRFYSRGLQKWVQLYESVSLRRCLDEMTRHSAEHPTHDYNIIQRIEVVAWKNGIALPPSAPEFKLEPTPTRGIRK